MRKEDAVLLASQRSRLSKARMQAQVSHDARQKKEVEARTRSERLALLRARQARRKPSGRRYAAWMMRELAGWNTADLV